MPLSKKSLGTLKNPQKEQFESTKIVKVFLNQNKKKSLIGILFLIPSDIPESWLSKQYSAVIPVYK